MSIVALNQVQTSREIFVEQAKLLGATIPALKQFTEEINNSRYNLADFALYAIIDGSGKHTIEVFASQDTEEIGIRNIANAKLQPGEYFLPTIIAMKAGSNPGAAGDQLTNAELAAIDFSSIKTYPALANGEHELEVRNNKIIPSSSNQWFVNEGSNLPQGWYPIVNPKMFEPAAGIELTIRMKNALPVKTGVLIVLFGTRAVAS